MFAHFGTSACMAGRGILRGREFERLRWEGGPLRAALVDVLRVHEWAYVRALQQVPPSCAACRRPPQGLASAPTPEGRVLAISVTWASCPRDMHWLACTQVNKRKCTDQPVHAVAASAAGMLLTYARSSTQTAKC